MRLFSLQKLLSSSFGLLVEEENEEKEEKEDALLHCDTCDRHLEMKMSELAIAIHI